MYMTVISLYHFDPVELQTFIFVIFQLSMVFFEFASAVDS